VRCEAGDLLLHVGVRGAAVVGAIAELLEGLFWMLFLKASVPLKIASRPWP